MKYLKPLLMAVFLLWLVRGILSAPVETGTTLRGWLDSLWLFLESVL